MSFRKVGMELCLLLASLLLTLGWEINILVLSLENVLLWILSIVESDPCTFGSCLPESFVVASITDHSLISHPHIALLLLWVFYCLKT